MEPTESSPKRVWTIFCHVHVESGRRYVGLTKKTWRQRWDQHVSQARRAKFSKSHWYNAIRKYGRDAFSHETLETVDTLEAANAAEEKWIAHYDTTNPEKGFNIQRGGAAYIHGPRPNQWEQPGYREKVCSRISETFQVRREESTALFDDPDRQAESLKAFAARVVEHVAIKAVVAPPKVAKVTKELTPDGIERSVRSKAYRAKPDVRKKFSALWDDPEYRAKCSAGARAQTAKLKAKTHCPQGHEYTEANTVVHNRVTAAGRPTQARTCRECLNARRRKRRGPNGRKVVRPGPWRYENGARTHCPKGHKFSGLNAILRWNPRRLLEYAVCRICENKTKRESAVRRRAESRLRSAS
jgi:hypothetical protein